MNKLNMKFLLSLCLISLLLVGVQGSAYDSTNLGPVSGNITKQTYILAVGETHSFDKDTYIYITPKCASGYNPYPMAAVKETGDSSDSCAPTGLTRLNQQGCISWDENEYRCSFRSENYYYSAVCPNKGIRIYYWVWCY